MKTDSQFQRYVLVEKGRAALPSLISMDAKMTVAA
jgi:hypothetical protein